MLWHIVCALNKNEAGRQADVSRILAMNPPGGGAFLNTKYSWQTNRGKTAERVVFRTKTFVKQQDSLSLILGTEIKASSEQFYNSERTKCSKATPWLLPSNNCKER